jgi:hypothetical protein
MAGLKRRVEILEDASMRGERQRLREALTYLSDEDLHALEDVLVAREEDPSASSEDLYRVAGERGRRAVVAINECLEALKEDREPQKGAHR